MGEKAHLFRYISKSGFVRSVFMRVLSIFIIVSIAIAAVAFYSFASEVRKNFLSDRQSQLAMVEQTISDRMEEATSIAYNISKDSAFYLEPVEGNDISGFEMSNTLSRYLVGNSFIEHLAYYRLSEPDTIYISNGERSLTEFFTSFGLSKEAAQQIIRNIQKSKTTEVRTIPFGSSGKSFFSYLYPLPQLSVDPKAFVLMLIPVEEVTPLFDTLMGDSGRMAAVFDGNGREIYRLDQTNEPLPLDSFVTGDSLQKEVKSEAGTKYILQKIVSDNNNWTYVSAIPKKDTLPGLANTQLIVIILLLLLVFFAMIAMFFTIIIQYKPISNLAEAMAGNTGNSSKVSDNVDERVLLSNTLTALKGDSEQKQKYETAFHEAEAANKAKSAFLSNMSHDIRTPMNAVVGMTSLALRHADDPEYVKDCLEKVQSSSQYLLDIINNVLDMSRIESGRITLSEDVIDLPVLMNGLIALLEPSMEAKHQKLNTDIGDPDQKTVIGDNVRLTQIFVNILSNSIKFTPEGGVISIHMKQSPSDDPECGVYAFTFTDTGIGMSPEFVGQVFDTFSRAKGVDMSKVEGTGLGMAIAKNLVELMGGTITCESELKKGTVFIVSIPMKFATEAERAGLSSGYQSALLSEKTTDDQIIDLKGKRILLVEDNAINREIAGQIITETGAEITEAVDGKEAVRIFTEHPEGHFHIILMDLQMPIMNGYEATASIRSLDRIDATSIPIYAMTANTFDEDVRQVKDAGMNGHIGKPYTPSMLYKMLEQALL